MIKQDEDPLVLFSGFRISVVATAGLLAPEYREREKEDDSYASCKMPETVRRSGDKPMLEMIAAVWSVEPLLSARAAPTMRRLQNAKRYSQPRRPGRPWRKRM